ncbi:Px [Sesbania mosaic virus]|uniref:Px n=1 Tax=Sesbania mosaic virus TaxID=12558 RepID=UPI0003D40602|nr:Px [Sesbania mosaic virus]
MVEFRGSTLLVKTGKCFSGLCGAQQERNTSIRVERKFAENVSSELQGLCPPPSQYGKLRDPCGHVPYGGAQPLTRCPGGGIDDFVRYSALVERLIRDLPAQVHVGEVVS